MENPLLTESTLPYGAPQFDKIRNDHYIPAFEEGIRQAKAEIDAITANQAEPDFQNTIEALEYSGRTLDRVSGIFYNLNEADTNPEMQEIAEKVAPMMTEYSMYVSLNEALFQRVKKVYDSRASLSLDEDQMKLLEDTYKSFARNGANLSDEDKALFSKYSEELSLLSLQFQKNSLAATNAFYINVTDENELAGLPQYVKDMGKDYAEEKGLDGWVFTLDYPCYAPFMKFCVSRDLRRQMYMGNAMKSVGGEFDNTGIVMKIVDLRMKMASLLGYGTYSDYALEEKMWRSYGNAENTTRKKWTHSWTESPGKSPAAALSATMTSASVPSTDSRRAGRNFLRNISPFQFNMTTAVFIRCKGIKTLYYFEPIHMKTIPMIISIRSRALARRFFSWKISTPQANDTITDPLRIRETTEIIESGRSSAEK